MLLGDFKVDPNLGAAEVTDAAVDAEPESVSIDAAAADSASDSAVPLGITKPVAIAANELGTCASLIYDSGTASAKRVTYCWGALGNPSELLGAASSDPAFGRFRRPRKLGTNAQDYLAFDRMSGNARGRYFLGLDTTSGQPYCWGKSDRGECGLDVNPPAVTLPVRVLAPTASFLGAGPSHGCYVGSQNVSPKGRLYCWGQNDACQVTGANATTRCPAVQWSVLDQSNNPTVGGGPFEFESFAGGLQHSCVVMRRQGTTQASVGCWGQNKSGQTGADQAIPIVDGPMVQSPPVKGLAFGDTELAAGENHTCVIAHKRDLTCWGANDVGQAAPSNRTAVQSPKRLELPADLGTPTLGHLALGGTMSCLVAAPVVGANAGIGRAYCFGAGALGRDPRAAVAQVTGIKRVTDLAVGGGHACAIALADADADSATPRVFCWGANAAKQVDPAASDASFLLPHTVTLPSRP
jgi:hypothetical protein